MLKGMALGARGCGYLHAGLLVHPGQVVIPSPIVDRVARGCGGRLRRTIVIQLVSIVTYETIEDQRRQ